MKCEKCGKYDGMLLLQKYPICGDCTRKAHRKALGKCAHVYTVRADSRIKKCKVCGHVDNEGARL